MEDNLNELNIELTAEIVSAYVSNNPVPVGELPSLIASVSTALGAIAGESNEPSETEKPKPPVSIRKSITPDYLISLEDGKQYKSLRRHLAKHGLTPDQYRDKWGLKADYPMVAANYSARRSELAKQMGLGRKPKEQPAPKRGRKKAAT